MADATPHNRAPRLPEGGKARRVYLLLHEEITRGLHAPGDALEGEQKLAQRLGVSRVTVRRALDALAQDVGVAGVFSDWPATVTFYANCMGL